MTGQTITHYEVLEQLGAGGMGVVYRGRDLHLNRFVALKFLAPELTRNDSAKQRFIQEAQAASALDHSNICTIHEIAETPEGQSFIVMACYEGETLKDRLERGPLKLDDALDIAIGIGAALAAAHESGIVHRDIKPANVMLTRRGEVKVVDFGLATLIGELGATRTRITQPGVTVGTVAYMSPEQALGDAVDQRTDIWALGVVLYEMVSGRRPFDGGQPASTLHAVAHVQPVPLTSLRTGVPIDLDRIVMRALAKSPRDRYQSAADLVSELTQLRHASDRAAMVATSAPAVLPRRWTWRRAAALLVSLVTLGAGAAYVVRGRNPDRVPTFANLVQVTSAIGVEDHPAWSPDGRTLAYDAGGSGPASVGGNWDIWVMQVGGGAAINRTTDHQGEDRFPVWSPDGRQIAFWSGRDGGGCFVMPALAGAPRKIATSSQFANDASRPQWSADGTKLACVTASFDAPDDVACQHRVAGKRRGQHDCPPRPRLPLRSGLVRGRPLLCVRHQRRGPQWRRVAIDGRPRRRREGRRGDRWTNEGPRAVLVRRWTMALLRDESRRRDGYLASVRRARRAHSPGRRSASRRGWRSGRRPSPRTARNWRIRKGERSPMSGVCRCYPIDRPPGPMRAR